MVVVFREAHLCCFEGEDVLLVGFPAFPPSVGLLPTFTHGVVTIRRTTSGMPALLSTTAASMMDTGDTLSIHSRNVAHPGSSGGMLLRRKDLSLVGLSTSALEVTICNPYTRHLVHALHCSLNRRTGLRSTVASGLRYPQHCCSRCGAT